MAARDYEYDAFILYNKANSPMSNTPDTELSLKFTEYLVGRLERWGITKNYYHERDSRPGSNIFKELTRLVNNSKWTIVILTQGFIKTCWNQYSSLHAFKKLMDKQQPHKLIPISIGLTDEQLPEELNVSDPVCFGNDWETDNHHCRSCWLKLENLLKGVEGDSPDDRHIHRPEAGDNVTRTERGVPVVQDAGCTVKQCILGWRSINRRRHGNEKEPHSAILESCYRKIVENMDARIVLDELVATRMFGFQTLKDIRQTTPQSDQNRQIIDLIRRNGWPGYETFKKILQNLQANNMWAEHILDALAREETSLNITGGATCDGLLPVDRGDHPDHRQQKSEQQQQSSVSSEPQASPAAIPPPPTLDHSIDAHNSIQNVVPDLPGAVRAASHPDDSLAASRQTTTIYTREMTQSMASLNLEEDAAPPTPLPSMSLQTGPQLSCPPPVTNQSAPVDQSNQSPSSNQSALPTKPPTSSQTTQSNQAALLNQPATPTETIETRISNQHSMALLNSQQTKSNLPTDSVKIDNDLINETIPKTSTVPLESTANRNNSNSNIKRGEITEEELKVETVPSLQNQQSLSGDQDLVVDNDSRSLDVSNAGISKPGEARGLESGPDLALNSLLDSPSLTTSGYSSCGSANTSQRPTPDSPTSGNRSTSESPELGSRQRPEGGNDQLGASVRLVENSSLGRVPDREQTEVKQVETGGTERAARDEIQPAEPAVLKTEEGTKGKTDPSISKTEATTSDPNQSSTQLSTQSATQPSITTVQSSNMTTSAQAESTVQVRGETTSVQTESTDPMRRASTSTQTESPQLSIGARLFRTGMFLFTQPEVAFSTWLK